MTFVCEFLVVGIPQPKGNHRARVVAGKHAVLYDANRKLPEWEKRVASAAKVHRPPSPLEGPVSVELVFWVPRGKTVKREWPTTRTGGDIDKLERGVLDALTGIIYVDDSQVVEVAKEKRYETTRLGPGCLVTVSELGEATR